MESVPPSPSSPAPELDGIDDDESSRRESFEWPTPRRESFDAPSPARQGDGRATPEWLRAAEVILQRDSRPASPPPPAPPLLRTESASPTASPPTASPPASPSKAAASSQPTLAGWKGAKLLDSAEVDASALPLDTLRSAVRRLMSGAGEVIDGGSDEAFELLVAMELILGHGFKRRGLNEGWLHSPTLWNFIQLLEKFHEPARKTIAFIRSSSVSDEARCSMWLRLCLNEGCLHQMLRTLYHEMPAQQLRAWYKESAFVRSDVWLTVLLSLCAGLDDVNFQLPLQIEEPGAAPLPPAAAGSSSSSGALEAGWEIAADAGVHVGPPPAQHSGQTLHVAPFLAGGSREAAAASGRASEEAARHALVWCPPPPQRPGGGAPPTAAAPPLSAAAARPAAAATPYVVPASALSSAAALFAAPPAVREQPPQPPRPPQPPQPLHVASSQPWPRPTPQTAATSTVAAAQAQAAQAVQAQARAQAQAAQAEAQAAQAAQAQAAALARAVQQAEAPSRVTLLTEAAVAVHAHEAARHTHTHTHAHVALAILEEREGAATSSEPPSPPSHAEATRAAAAALYASAAWPLHVPQPMKLLGAELIRARDVYTAYKLQMVDGKGDAVGEPIYRRFSQFVQLATSLCALKPTRTMPSLDAATTQQLQEWKRRLVAEKRRLGALALKPDVVGARCAMLQQVLDLICAPPLCALPDVRTFCGLAPPGPSAAQQASASMRSASATASVRSSGSEASVAAPKYSATCPSCGRGLRVAAPARDEAEPTLFRCPAEGCGAVFRISLKPD